MKLGVRAREDAMHRTLTISLPDDVYQGLRAKVGEDNMSQFIADAVRPHVSTDDLERAYREMAADEEREREALEWLEADLGDGLE
jgi:predicted CopG family antitoxin